MKRKFTFLITAALMLLTMMATTGQLWGQTKITDYSNIVSGNTYYIGATTGGTDYYLYVYHDYNSTSTAGTAQTSMNDATTFVFEGSGTSWTLKFDNGKYLSLKDGKDNGKVQVVADPATFTTSNQSGKIRLSKGSYSVQKNNSTTNFGSYANTQTDIWLMEVPSSLSLTTVTIDDSGITNTDVHTSTSAGTLSATVTENTNNTVISGAIVTWSSSNTGVATIANDGSITLVAEGTTTITAYYAGVSGEYGESSATYELNVSDSTPFTGGVVTFVAGTDTGSTTTTGADQMTKKVVTISSTSAAFATAEYRLYSGSTTTISTSLGTITQIEFTKNGNYSLGNLSTETGTYTSSTGVWTGDATSIEFSAAAQVRLDQIAVTVTAPTTDPSINASDVNITYDATGGNIGYTIINPDDDATLEAEVVEGATISNFTLGAVSDNTIAFTCDANTVTTARTATVTLNYVKNSNVLATKNVTITQAALPTIYTSFADLLAAAPTTAANVYINFQDWVITGANSSQHAFLSDGTNGCIIFGSNHGFTAGDILSGTVQCKFQNYNGALELTNLTSTSTGLTVTSGGTVTVANIPMAELTGVNTGALVHYENLDCEARLEGQYTNYYLKDADNNEIQVYKTLLDNYADYLENGKTYNITGVFVLNNTTKRVNPRIADDIEEVIVVTPVISAENVEIAYDATSGEIAYTISNPVSSVELGATTTADWVSDIAVTADKVTFNTTINENTEDRVATFTLTYEGAEDKVVTVTQGHQVAPPTPGAWILTNLEDLTGTDIFVIVGTYTSDESSYAMSNDNGISNAPAAVEVTVTDGTLSGEIADNIQWNISGNATDGYTFYPNGDNESWLYINSGNNARCFVGTNEDNTFVLSDYGYLKHVATEKYIGIYNSQDWRGYVGPSIHSNISGESFAFYKKVTGPIISATPSPFTAPSYEFGTADPSYEVLTVNGHYLTDDITVALNENSDFEMSADLTEWTNSLTLTQTEGNITNAEIAIRLKAGLAVNSYEGTVTLTSEGATDFVVELSGTVTEHEYNIVLDTEIFGGTIEADKEKAPAGGIVTLTAHPAAGYDFTSWEVLDDNFESVIVNDNQFEMPASDVLVSATFTPKETYLITTVANPTEGGTIITDATEDKAYEGQTVTLTCEAASGYSLTSIVITKTVDGSDTGITPVASGDGYTFEMPGYAVTATATFEEFVDYVTLPFEWEGGTTADLSNNTGVTVYSGGNYGDTHAPYQVKFNNEGHYIQIKTDSQIETVSVGVKKIGGAPVSKIIIKESADGTNFEEVETFELEGAQNAILNLETSNEFDASTRFIQIYFNKTGQNVGVGPITITKFSTEPVINAENVDLAYDATSGEIGYTITRPVTGITLEASTTADWISDIQVTEEKVTFNTTQNEGEEDRVATFTLSYTGAENKEVTVTQAHFVVDFATLPFAFDGGRNDIENTAGLTQDGLDSDYGSSPKLKFNTAGDWMILKLNAAPVSIIYDIKGNGSGQTPWAGTFKVQVSGDGTEYEDLKVYENNLGDVQTDTIINNITNNTDVRYIKWIYTQKTTGNVALGNIQVYDVEFTIINNSTTIHDLTIADGEAIVVNTDVVLELTGTVTNPKPANLIVREGGQLIHESDVEATVQKGISAYSTKSGDGWYLIASPVDELSTSGLITEPATSYDLFIYNEPNAYWYSNIGTGAPFDILERGKGYLYANANNIDLDFAGLMIGTETEVTKTLSFAYDGGGDLKGYNLMGNPFTRNIGNGDMTLDGEPVTSVLILNNDEEYQTCNFLESGTIKPGQGFFIQATAENQELTFNPSLSKDASEIGLISIKAGNESYFDKAYIQIGGGNTLRKMTFYGDKSQVYVMNDDLDYAAARVEELAGTIPVHFVPIADGFYTITVETKNIENLNYMHLIDNITNTDIDLLAEPSYTFKASESDNADRFHLVFDFNNYTGVNENYTNDNFAHQIGDEIFVSGEGTLQVFDVLGRFVTGYNVNGDKRISTAEFNTGVYIFRMVGTEVKTQKIIVR